MNCSHNFTFHTSEKPKEKPYLNFYPSFRLLSLSVKCSRTCFCFALHKKTGGPNQTLRQSISNLLEVFPILPLIYKRKNILGDKGPSRKEMILKLHSFLLPQKRNRVFRKNSSIVFECSRSTGSYPKHPTAVATVKGRA